MEPYVKRCGNPPPGSRVYIQTRRQRDGQQAGPAQTDALGPGTGMPQGAGGAGGWKKES